MMSDGTDVGNGANEGMNHTHPYTLVLSYGRCKGVCFVIDNIILPECVVRTYACVGACVRVCVHVCGCVKTLTP